jgi:hypothetical protein
LLSHPAHAQAGRSSEGLLSAPRSPPARGFLFSSGKRQLQTLTYVREADASLAHQIPLGRRERGTRETRSERRHLLLGNGFRISGYPGFAYTSLLAETARRSQSVADFFASTGAQGIERGMALAEPELRDEIRRCLR